jgi:predicted membrane protein
VQKISNVFSFMGGLIGALMAGLFIVHAYTSFAYEISIAI